MRFFILAFYFSVASGFLAAQSTQGLKQAGGFLYYDTILNNPTGIKDLPLIVAFHYSSSNPKEAITEYDSVKMPVRIIAPQGNFRKREGYTYFPSDYYSLDSTAQMRISKTYVDSIAIFLKAIIKKYKRKPIVAGFSQGGDISFLLGIFYPDLVKAAFPLAGFVHRQRFDEVKKHSQKTVPIYIFQGEDDKIVSVNYSRKEVLELNSHFNISIKTYSGLGHDFSPQMKRDYAIQMTEQLKRK